MPILEYSILRREAKGDDYWVVDTRPNRATAFRRAKELKAEEDASYTKKWADRFYIAILEEVE